MHATLRVCLDTACGQPHIAPVGALTSCIGSRHYAGRVLAGLPYRYHVAAVFVVALFVDVLDTTVVNVALPTLGRELRVGNETLEWVVTGYLLGLAVFIPASGWIGDRFGTKRTFLFALGVFLAGSALSGVAWNAGWLIAFRVVQGIGGGLLTPVGTAMVVRAFPPQQRATGSAIIGVPAVLAPVVGPVLGGLLVDSVGWRWIFFVNLPVGLIGLVYAWLVLKEHVEHPTGGFDPIGFITAGLGLGCALYGLSRVPTVGWASPVVIGWGFAALSCGLVLIFFERRRSEPMLDLRLFDDTLFSTTNLTHILATAGLVGVLFLVPLYLQQLRGLSALASGLTSVPQALGLVCMVPTASWLYGRVGARPLVAAGMAGSAVSAALLVLLDANTDLWWVRAILFTRGLAFGLALLPLQTAAFARVGTAATGRASAIFNTGRHVAASLGVAALTSVLAIGGGLAGFQAAFAAGAVLGLVGTLSATRIPPGGRDI
jgi:EmrB/QacA subfamily drug resistance transporter